MSNQKDYRTAIILLGEIEKWSEKYEFSFQFWGEGNMNVFIYKDGIELFCAGGRNTVYEILTEAMNFVRKINKEATLP